MEAWAFSLLSWLLRSFFLQLFWENLRAGCMSNGCLLNFIIKTMPHSHQLNYPNHNQPGLPSINIFTRIQVARNPLFCVRTCTNQQAQGDQRLENQNYISFESMSILNLEEVLSHELLLLQTDGPNLSSFYTIDPEAQIFNLSYPTNSYAAKKLAFPQSTPNHPNSVFDIITCVMLKVYFGPEGKTELLQHLKCTLYAPKITINDAEGFPYRHLPDSILKKMLVEFFQVMQYHEGKVEDILVRYPIILPIFASFFRTILHKLGVPNALNYQLRISPNLAICRIFDYFDIGYQFRKGVCVVADEEIGIYVEPKTEQIFMGSIEAIPTKESEHSFDFEDTSCNLEPFDFDRRDQSISTPTPHFGQFTDEQLSFNRLSHRRKNSTCEFNQSKKYNPRFEEEPIEEIADEYEEDLKNSYKKPHASRRKSQNDIKVISDPKKILQSLKKHLDEPNPKKSQDAQNKVAHKCQDHKPSVRKASMQPQTKDSDDLLLFEHKSVNFHNEKASSPNSALLSSQYGYSCTCSQRKAQRNRINSNVVGVEVKPTSTPRVPQLLLSSVLLNPQTDRRPRQKTDHSSNIPAFLKKSTFCSPNSTKLSSSIEARMSQPLKINFTYQAPANNPMIMSSRECRRSFALPNYVQEIRQQAPQPGWMTYRQEIPVSRSYYPQQSFRPPTYKY